MAGPSLQQVQELLSKLIRTPEGVGPALPALSLEEQARWQGLIRHGGALDPIERLDIYANMYFFRIRDALADDFPVVRATIGADAFHNFVTDYLLAHPSRSFSLRDVGSAVPQFARSHPYTGTWPWLGDLAALEWSVVEAFDAADAPMLSAEQWAAYAAEELANRRLVWHPSLRVLACEYPVHQAWQRFQRDEPLPTLAPEETWIRVWRNQERVFVAAMTRDEATVLRSHETLADAGEFLAATYGQSRATELLANWLVAWVQSGVLCGVEPITRREQR